MSLRGLKISMAVNLKQLLERFDATLRNALELHTNATKALDYSFSSRSLKQLLEEHYSKEMTDVAHIVSRIIALIFRALHSALVAFAKEKGIPIELDDTVDEWILYERGSGARLAEVVANCLIFFCALYDARSVPHLFTVEQLTYMDDIRSAAITVVKFVGLKAFGLEMPANVLRMCELEVTEDANSRILRTIFGFDKKEPATEQGSCSISEKEKRRSAFLAGCERLLKEIDAGRFDVLEMKNLSESQVTGSFVPEDLLLKLAEKLPDASKHVDVRVADTFFGLLKKLFVCCSDIDKAMRTFYSQSRSANGDGQLPNWKKYYSAAKYDKELVRIINGIGDQNIFANNPCLLERTAKDIGFLFFIAVKPTLWSVLHHCLDNRLIVPNVMKVLRQLHAIREEKLEISDGKDNAEKRQIPIVLYAVRRMLHLESMSSDDRRKNFAYLVSSLSRERRAIIKGKQESMSLSSNEDPQAVIHYGEVVERALVDGVELLRGFILPELFNQVEVSLVLEILHRCLSDLGARRTPIQWCTEVTDVDYSESTFFEDMSAPILLKLLIDIFCSNSREDKEIDSLCLKCIAALGANLACNEVLFDERTSDFILKCLNKHDWTLKYATVTWLSTSLRNPKREIPTGLYKALSEELQRNYQQIVVDFEFSATECFLRSIFELAALSPKLAVEFINQGFTVRPGEEELCRKISVALLDVVSRNHSTVEIIIGMYEVLKALLLALDAAVSPNLPIAFTESALYGFHLIQPLLVLGETVIIAYLGCEGNSSWKAESRHCVEIAERLLQAFCQISKNHMEREMIDLRRSRQQNVNINIRDPRAIPEGAQINRFSRVFMQLSQLFCSCCMITVDAKGIPDHLKVLLVTFANYQAELQEMYLGPSLDFIKTDSRAGSVVYAYANPKEQKIENSGGEEEGTTEETAANSQSREKGSSEKKRSDEDISNIEVDRSTSATNKLFEMANKSTLPETVSSLAQPGSTETTSYATCSNFAPCSSETVSGHSFFMTNVQEQAACGGSNTVSAKVLPPPRGIDDTELPKASARRVAGRRGCGPQRSSRFSKLDRRKQLREGHDARFKEDSKRYQNEFPAAAAANLVTTVSSIERHEIEYDDKRSEEKVKAGVDDEHRGMRTVKSSRNNVMNQQNGAVESNNVGGKLGNSQISMSGRNEHHMVRMKRHSEGDERDYSRRGPRNFSRNENSGQRDVEGRNGNDAVRYRRGGYGHSHHTMLGSETETKSAASDGFSLLAEVNSESFVPIRTENCTGDLLFKGMVNEVPDRGTRELVSNRLGADKRSTFENGRGRNRDSGFRNQRMQENGSRTAGGTAHYGGDNSGGGRGRKNGKKNKQN